MIRPLLREIYLYYYTINVIKVFFIIDRRWNKFTRCYWTATPASSPSVTYANDLLFLFSTGDRTFPWWVIVTCLFDARYLEYWFSFHLVEISKRSLIHSIATLVSEIKYYRVLSWRVSAHVGYRLLAWTWVLNVSRVASQAFRFIFIRRIRLN